MWLHFPNKSTVIRYLGSNHHNIQYMDVHDWRSAGWYYESWSHHVYGMMYLYANVLWSVIYSFHAFGVALIKRNWTMGHNGQYLRHSDWIQKDNRRICYQRSLPQCDNKHKPCKIFCRPQTDLQKWPWRRRKIIMRRRKIIMRPKFFKDSAGSFLSLH